METSIVLLGSLGLLLFGFALWVSVQILSDRDPSQGDDVIRTLLKVAAWVIISAALLAGPILLSIFHADEVIGPAILFLLVGFPITVVVCVLVWWQCRVARQHGFLWMLTVTAERKMPLAPSIEAFAEEQGGAYGRRLKLLADRLRAGMTLPRALMHSPGLVPRNSSMMIHLGLQSSALGDALRQVLDLRESRTPAWIQLAIRTGYLCGVALFAFGVLSFIMLHVSPAFQKIFFDFGSELPPLTQFVIDTPEMLARCWYLGFPIFLILAGLFGFLLIVYPNSRVVISHIVQFLPRRLDTATLFDALALIINKGRPLNDGIVTMANIFPRQSVRSQLSCVNRDLRAGIEWTASLVQRNLISPADQAVLLAAQRIDNLPWVLREMAECNRRRTAYRFDLILQVLFPLVLILYSIVVMFIVVGYFLPLITLIECLT